MLRSLAEQYIRNLDKRMRNQVVPEVVTQTVSLR